MCSREEVAQRATDVSCDRRAFCDEEWGGGRTSRFVTILVAACRTASTAACSSCVSRSPLEFTSARLKRSMPAATLRPDIPPSMISTRARAVMPWRRMLPFRSIPSSIKGSPARCSPVTARANPSVPACPQSSIAMDISRSIADPRGTDSRTVASMSQIPIPLLERRLRLATCESTLLVDNVESAASVGTGASSRR